MVFACRFLLLCYSENIQHQTKTRAKSTSAESFYTADSDLNRNRSGPVPSPPDATHRIPDDTQRWDLPSVSETPSNNLRVFTLAELKKATRNFAKSSKIGEGGFGSVYKGVVKSLEHPFHKIDVAVKKHDDTGFQGYTEWVTEVKVLGKIEHPNLVKLIGYCVEGGIESNKLLVYEYMRKGSVHDHLSGRLGTPPSWALRLRIALDTASGLAYLHEGMDYSIIMRDFKASNVLLDHHWNSKLSDFGYARSGPSEGHSHVTTRVVGTYGYRAPEYTDTGHLTTKCDVFSYGVFLYVLITGKPAVDPNCLENERVQWLHEWMQPYLKSDQSFYQIIDPRIRGNVPLPSAQRLSKIAERCLFRDPKDRPSMSDVFMMVQQLVSKFMMVQQLVSKFLPSSLNLHPEGGSNKQTASKKQNSKSKRRLK